MAVAATRGACCIATGTAGRRQPAGPLPRRGGSGRDACGAPEERGKLGEHGLAQDDGVARVPRRTEDLRQQADWSVGLCIGESTIRSISGHTISTAGAHGEDGASRGEFSGRCKGGRHADRLYGVGIHQAEEIDSIYGVGIHQAEEIDSIFRSLQLLESNAEYEFFMRCYTVTVLKLIQHHQDNRVLDTCDMIGGKLILSPMNADIYFRSSA